MHDNASVLWRSQDQLAEDKKFGPGIVPTNSCLSTAGKEADKAKETIALFYNRRLQDSV